MKWKDKYIIGMTVMSMFFTLPLVSAEEEVVVYGDEFDNGDETAVTDESTPTDEGGTTSEIPIETSEEQVVEPEGTTETEDTTYGEEEPQSELPVDTPVEENPIVEENTNPYDGTVEDDSGNGSSGTYEETAPVEMPIEESQTDPEDEPLSTETPIDDPPVEESTVYTEGENLGESTGTTLNDGNENTTIGLDDGTTGIYTNRFGDGEDESANVKTPVTTSDTTTPRTEITTKRSSKTESEKNLKTQKARFVKLLSDDTYEYYLDRSAVRWVSMPYSTSEYMADVWIRMIEKNPSQSEDMPSDMYQYLNSGGNEISDAAEKGLGYNEVDKKVLRSRKYFLEHYYIRPKARQIQFLCELEVIGRPQNAISERPYEYKNWENLIPGSVESYIYSGTLAEIGTGKSKKRGHMTFVDMLDEYARIALN